MYLIELMDNKSEIIAYNVPDMPVKSCFSKQADFPMLSIANHWHSDFEFLYILKGKINYCVDGEKCTASEGQMIFVNSARLHYGFWDEVSECDFICTIFHPSLIQNNLARKYLDSITDKKAPPFLILRPEIAREKKLIDLIVKFNDAAVKADEGYELTIMSCIYEITGLLVALIKSAPDTIHKDSRQLEAMHRMVGFIQQNYSKKISLAEIAEAGFVSRSTCCEIFKKYADKPPVEYLTEYRIGKSAELLLSSGFNVTEIAEQCGFGGASYFTETFRKIMGCTPTEYRQRK